MPHPSIERDPLLLIVKGSGVADSKAYRSKLASTLLLVLRKHGEAVLRLVGAAAAMNAMMSLAIAKDMLKKGNGSLVCDAPDFHMVSFDREPDNPMTGLSIRVRLLES